ncbi:hypothetical protein SEA_OBLADI_58 [Gordonia phage ObLaDi]|uniref:Uncharacterized protein n=1 Tax=Gordonia phage ObLaDi TaxID=2978487 RepID=A0A977KN51_9CAUD|nr:hypothetical protein SEA_OBLADI_58 [Gordonia phage ObLaDi]
MIGHRMAPDDMPLWHIPDDPFDVGAWAFVPDRWEFPTFAFPAPPHPRRLRPISEALSEVLSTGDLSVVIRREYLHHFAEAATSRAADEAVAVQQGQRDVNLPVCQRSTCRVCDGLELFDPRVYRETLTALHAHSATRVGA